jgi:multidrug efflux pump subunit AcrA (membrane-fusion protein)
MTFTTPAEPMRAESEVISEKLIEFFARTPRLAARQCLRRAAVLCRFRTEARSLAGVVLLIFFSSLFPSACSKKSEEAPAAAAAEKKEESRVSHGTNGETIIKLDAETQKRMGLQTGVLSSAQLAPEVKGYGRVVDAAPLAASVADLTSATAASAASQAELERLKTLAAQNNASARALQSAEAAAIHDQSQTDAARLRLLASWGNAIASRQDLPAFVRSLGSLDSALIQLNLSPDQSLKDPPTGAQILTLSDETKPIEAQFLGPASSVDPQVQGRGFLFLVSPNPSRLAPGAAVAGYINVPGEPQSGVAVPRNAVVRFNGAAWVYVQTANDTFERTEAKLERPMQDSWFVREGLKPGAKVVTTGPQEILSEELKGQEE